MADAQVLAVGCDTATLSVLDRYLTHRGIKIEIVADGPEAVTACAQRTEQGRPYDLVFVDYLLAEADGLRVGRDLLASEAVASTVLVLPYGAQALQGEAEAAGFAGSLMRPIGRDLLWRTAAVALGLADRDVALAPKGAASRHYTPPAVEAARAAGALILVAEDNATNQVVIRKILDKLGFAAEIADDGVAALHMLEDGAHGLLLTDCHMPEMDGYELTGEVRARERAGGGSPHHALPEPLGSVRDEFQVDRATATAYTLKAGEMVQIIDIDGCQCSDFMALREDALARGHERFIDGTVTRSMVRGAYPMPGLADKFFDQDMVPLLSVVRDTVGRHDTFGLACTARGYEDRGFPGHINCSDNISDAYEPHGISRRDAWPAVNLFFNSWILPSDNVFGAGEGWSRPGDYIVMKALTDLVCVSTACPDDVDPINGWNPTDVHVRIYTPDTTISRAVAYRPEPHSEAILTQESAFHPRTSALTQQFHPVRDVWLPTKYDATGALEEYWACRKDVAVQDMSSLRKFDIMGPDAESLLQTALTKDVRKLAVNRGAYALMLDDTGSVIDDGTLFRMSAEVFRWCCGSDESGLTLKAIAEEKNLRVWIKSHFNALANLAVQGPKSRELLSRVVFTQPTQPALESLKWFGWTAARLHDRDGAPFMLTRTGYTGELGYEIFCDRADALDLWDALFAAGADLGVQPMGAEALGMIRVEAGFMAAGAEFGPDVDALEAGLGFAIAESNDAYVGRDAIARNRAAPRRQLIGLHLDGDETPVHGDGVIAGTRRIGTVTSATRSPELGHAIAMARIATEHAATGTTLEIGCLDGHMKRLSATVTEIPFVDPTRSRARS